QQSKVENGRRQAVHYDRWRRDPRRQGKWDFGRTQGHGGAGEKRRIVALEDGSEGAQPAQQIAQQQNTGDVHHGQHQQRSEETERQPGGAAFEQQSAGQRGGAGEQQAAAIQDGAHGGGGLPEEA